MKRGCTERTTASNDAFTWGRKLYRVSALCLDIQLFITGFFKKYYPYEFTDLQWKRTRWNIDGAGGYPALDITAQGSAP